MMRSKVIKVIQGSKRYIACFIDREIRRHSWFANHLVCQNSAIFVKGVRLLCHEGATDYPLFLSKQSDSDHEACHPYPLPDSLYAILLYKSILLSSPQMQRETKRDHVGVCPSVSPLHLQTRVKFFSRKVSILAHNFAPHLSIFDQLGRQMSHMKPMDLIRSKITNRGELLQNLVKYVGFCFENSVVKCSPIQKSYHQSAL